MKLLKTSGEALASEESKYDDYFTLNNVSDKLKEVRSRIIDGDKMTHQRQSGINLSTKITKKRE